MAYDLNGNSPREFTPELLKEAARASIGWNEMKEEIRQMIRDELDSIRKNTKWYKHSKDAVLDSYASLSSEELGRIHKEFEV